jgi:DNA polymerase-1
MDETKVFAKDKGYVETAFGRRMWLPEINGGNGPRRSGAERQAINAPMQGTAADLIKLAMMAVQQTHRRRAAWPRAWSCRCTTNWCFEVPEAELDWAREAVPRLMAGVARSRSRLLAEVGVGNNWDEAH